MRCWRIWHEFGLGLKTDAECSRVAVRLPCVRNGIECLAGGAAVCGTLGKEHLGRMEVER